MPNMIDWYSKEEKLGMNHEPNKCLCINRLKQYKRRDKILWLCSCCHLSGDEDHVEKHKQKPQTQPQEKATFYPTEFANRIRADERAKTLKYIWDNFTLTGKLNKYIGDEVGKEAELKEIK